jgi:hypothetical protein
LPPTTGQYPADAYADRIDSIPDGLEEDDPNRKSFDPPTDAPEEACL